MSSAPFDPARFKEQMDAAVKGVQAFAQYVNAVTRIRLFHDAILKGNQNEAAKIAGLIPEEQRRTLATQYAGAIDILRSPELYRES